jgi:hypothetical protein
MNMRFLSSAEALHGRVQAQGPKPAATGKLLTLQAGLATKMSSSAHWWRCDLQLKSALLPPRCRLLKQLLSSHSGPVLPHLSCLSICWPR